MVRSRGPPTDRVYLAVSPAQAGTCVPARGGWDVRCVPQPHLLLWRRDARRLYEFIRGHTQVYLYLNSMLMLTIYR